jgi:hypothetical protein
LRVFGAGWRNAHTQAGGFGIAQENLQLTRWATQALYQPRRQFLRIGKVNQRIFFRSGHIVNLILLSPCSHHVATM